VKLIISTTGMASPSYHGPSTAEDIAVPQVELIQYGSRRAHPEPDLNRDYAFIDLTTDQAVALATSLLMQLVEDGVLTGWNLDTKQGGK
jgi:hypothetical protein